MYLYFLQHETPWLPLWASVPACIQVLLVEAYRYNYSLWNLIGTITQTYRDEKRVGGRETSPPRNKRNDND